MPKKRSTDPKSRGYRLLGETKRSGGKMILTDEQVLFIRSQHEFDGVSAKDLLAKYPDLSVDYMRQLLEYRTRSKLIPRRRA